MTPYCINLRVQLILKQIPCSLHTADLTTEVRRQIQRLSSLIYLANEEDLLCESPTTVNGHITLQ